MSSSSQNPETVPLLAHARNMASGADDFGGPPVDKNPQDTIPVAYEDEKNSKKAPTVEIRKESDELLLSHPGSERRFWFQRGSKFDTSAIATQRSVFDDPDLAKHYQPGPDWENLHRFDPSARWTWGEEYKLIRKIDLRIMVFACIMFMALELDRSNLSQALTDNFLGDLGMNTNDYNLGETVFKLSFLCAELPSQLVKLSLEFYKEDLFQMCVILYLSYFYKHHELSLRLGFFWTAMSIADILASFLAYGILHLRGHEGHSGWRWLFLLEGILTLVIGLIAYVLMPPGPTQTANWARGKKGWFSEREETIMVNRVIREDPSKSDMHNREALTPKMLWQSLKDFDIWPLYILGLTFQIPMTTPKNYLTLTLKTLGFSTFTTNLLVIPSQVIHIFTMLGITYLAEVWQNLTFTAMIGQIWAFPFVLVLYILDINQLNHWVAWGIMTIFLSYPSAHPIQVAWNSRISNTVRSRTVSAAMYNMFVQASGIIASNIYREDDKPRYLRGNRALLAVNIMNIILYLLTKAYYVWRNKSKAKKWNSLTQEEREEYLATTTDKGNKRLDFQFVH
ncbi:MFS general substrate transporter [Lasiodiplodia theobromae]|uniref:Phthalate transporter protein n=1 Tax=Lasiodiplodia theobromae TaxID=45133 RepID=UPI0015C3A404|nr:Phthalate transporter protein [Lasiodiplodia theobromae]KAF4538709.1 Phthalate transporter protein [Lasiodiplodia theobromae]KAF9637602.1 MFS general substrate transporter [Lasiodiplodia theobromae]